MASFLGLDHWFKEKKLKPNKIKRELESLLELAEKEIATVKPPAFLTLNINKLSRIVGLNDTDHAILMFAILLNNEVFLRDASYFICSDLSITKVSTVISVILNIE